MKHMMRLLLNIDKRGAQDPNHLGDIWYKRRTKMLKKKKCATKKGKWSQEYKVKVTVAPVKKKKKGAWAEKDKGHAWKVVIAGKDSGIVESNYPYASKYWAKRAKVLDKKIKLQKIW
jgi:hypothetical protein